MKVKFATIGLSLAFVLSAAAPAGAVTVAELQAQINALMAQLASLQGGTVSTGASITSDLTVGSSGAQVVALQSALVAQGHLVMPAGVAMGYFGSLTKAAVMKWQAANGVPATGYFGPLSRAKFNGSAGATGTVPGTTVGGSVSVGVITTPGVEGTITVSKGATPASGVKLYEGADKVGVLGIKLEAKTSDIKIERIKLDLDVSAGGGVDTDFFRKIADKLYIMDGSTVIGSIDLSNSTVVEDGSDYFITVAGLNYVVPKDATRNLTVALRARANWDSAFNGDTFQVTVPVEGVRGVDGAGVNQYGPATAFNNTFTSEDDILETATLNISTNASTPQDSEKVCTSGADEDECDGLELLRFDVRAEKDNVVLTDLIVNLTRVHGAGSASTTVAYLMEGSTVIGSETVTNFVAQNSVTFDDIDFTIAKDSTKTLSFKIDVDDAAIAKTTFAASTTASLATAENSAGTAITESGSATGEEITVRKVGPEFSLVSKSITYTPSGGFSGATSSAKADFVIRMKAVGGDIVFGDSASTTYPLVVLGTPTGATASSSVVYRGGAQVSGTTVANSLTHVASSTAITVPSGVTSTTTNSWTLAEGNTIDIPVSMVFNARSGVGTALGDGGEITTGAYAVQINQLFWATASDAGERHVSDFMSGNSAWRTGTVTLP